MGEAQKCERCRRSMTPETAVHLWDGKDYCRDCLLRASPRLLDYALEHDSLEETLSYDFSTLVWKPPRILVYLNVLALFIIAYKALDFGLSNIGASQFHTTLCIVGVLNAVVLVPALLNYVGTRAMPPRASLKDGRLLFSWTPWYRAWFPRRPREFKLSECRWYVGRLKDSRQLDDTPSISAIILVTARHYILGVVQVRRAASCGWSDEMFRIWQEFLTFIALPRTDAIGVQPGTYIFPFGRWWVD